MQTILNRDKNNEAIITKMKSGFNGDMEKLCPIDTSQARKFVRGLPYLSTKHLRGAGGYYRKVQVYLVAEMQKTNEDGITIYHDSQFGVGTKHGNFLITLGQFYDLFNFDMFESGIIRFFVL